MIRLVVIVLIVLLVAQVVRGAFKRRKTVVVADERGVALRGWGLTSRLDWEAVRRIEIERMPAAGTVFFCVVLAGARRESLAVYGDFPGFDNFKAWMFHRWPAIRPEWMRVFAGPSDISERVTVWKKEQG